jgi:hypothetical protein
MREFIPLIFKPPINVTDANTPTDQTKSFEMSRLKVKKIELTKFTLPYDKPK